MSLEMKLLYLDTYIYRQPIGQPMFGSQLKPFSHPLPVTPINIAPKKIQVYISWHFMAWQ
jgi:hypothetical protein